MLAGLHEQLKRSSVPFGPGGGPVVLVDDDFDDRALLRREVRFLFGDVPLKVFENGAQLMDWLRAEEAKGEAAFEKNRPKLILLDLHMPKMNGIDTLHMLRGHRQYADIPVIVISAGLNDREALAAAEGGAIACLAKTSHLGKGATP